MDLQAQLEVLARHITECSEDARPGLLRIQAELGFAARFSELNLADRARWEGPIAAAADGLISGLETGAGVAELVAQAESLLLPLGRAAKEYTIHLCGHAHIDMNWTWPWLETIAICHDTFLTVDRLMRLFPEFIFAQPQVTVYEAMENHCPEVFDIIGDRIFDRRWDPVVSQWLELDKNMTSGESQCRHLLYAKRYMHERFGIPYDDIKIDWEGDTFGHPVTVPAILSRGGVSRHYHQRAGTKHWCVWWQAPDGSRVLSYFDKSGYGGPIGPQIGDLLVDCAADTGLRDFLYVYGVVDHGGGPTRADLLAAREMQDWPIFPTLRHSTTDEFFTAVEQSGIQLPVVTDELNTVFEGCYTSQSKAKLVNRRAESLLPEAEAFALLAEVALCREYPVGDFRRAWRMAMFNQFHDILAGSSGHMAMEEAAARFGELEGLAGTIKFRTLRDLADRVDMGDIAELLGAEPGAHKLPAPDGPLSTIEAMGAGATIGFGAGNIRVPGSVSTWSHGEPFGEPLVIFNPSAFPRSAMVATKLWNREYAPERIAVTDCEGRRVAGQVIGRSWYNTHSGVDVLFPVCDVPPLGYRAYILHEAEAPLAGGVSRPSEHMLENEHLRVQVDPASGAIRSLVDVASGFDHVPEGGLLGVLEMLQEAPHAMTAWEIGEITQHQTLTEGGIPDDGSDLRFSRSGDGLGMVQAQRDDYAGPQRAAIRTLHDVGQSRVCLEVALDAGSRSVEITLQAWWREIGTPETGVPMLRMAFPLNVIEPVATYEIPFGSICRPCNGQEVPALRWADLSGRRQGGGRAGLTLLNDHKHGHSALGRTLRLTLLRSTYDPDPFPEVGFHTIRLSLLPHEGACPVAEAMRQAEAFNVPLSVVGTELRGGGLQPTGSYAEVLTDNVILASLKRAEDSEALIVRLYEVEGTATEARVRLSGLVEGEAEAQEVDLLERPLQTSTARMEGETLVVTVPAYGIATVRVG